MNLFFYLLCTGVLLYLAVYYSSSVLVFLLLCMLLLPAGLWALAGFSAARGKGYLHGSTQQWDPRQKTAPAVFLRLNPCPFPVPPIKWRVLCNCSLATTRSKIVIDTLVQPPQRQGYPIPLPINGCGVYQFTITSARGCDYLHLFPLWARYHKNPFTLTILPTIYPCSITWQGQMQAAFTHQDSTQSHKKGQDYTELFDLRPYAPGDKPSLIHWKLSHKTDQLFVKEGSAPHIGDLVLFADLRLQRQCLMDGLFSVSLGLLKGQCSHHLCWFDNIALRRVHITQPNQLYALASILLAIPKVSHQLEPEALYAANYPAEPPFAFVLVSDSLYANSRQLLPPGDFPQNMERFSLNF